MPVLGVYGPNDDRNGVPQMGLATSAFQGMTVGATTLTVQTTQTTQVTVAVGDQRGDGRPDFNYQGRMFYADSVGPETVATGGGTITITGMGFRTGNAVLVNGVAATVKSWTANSIVAVTPTMTTAQASNGAAVDVEVMDRGTGATSTMYGALVYQGSGALPHAMVVVSAPSGNVPVGTAAGTAFAVRVVLADGVTPVAGESVTFQVSAGTATLGACGGVSCTLRTDATGLAQTTVTPGAAGRVTVQAADGSVTEVVTFTGQAAVGSIVILNAPSGTVAGGQSAGAPFLVEVLQADGVTPLYGQTVTFTVAQGSATFDGCNAAQCAATTGGDGLAAMTVTPGAAGPVTLVAADNGVSAQASFTSGGNVDSMALLAAPKTAFVNENAGDFTVQLLKPDGVTPDTTKAVTLSGTAGVVFSTCGTNPCTLATDYAGRSGSTVVIGAVGTYTVQAAYGGLVQRATIVVTARSQTLTVVSTPGNGSLVGVTAGTPFAVRFVDFDGVTPVAGSVLTMAGPAGVTLSACGSNSCNVTTDGNGVATTNVLPLTAGTMALDAVSWPVLVSTSFTAVTGQEQMQVVTQPGNGPIYAGDAETFSVRLMQPDGVTPDAGKNVTFLVTNWSGCGGGSCSVVTDSGGLATISGSAVGAGSVVLQATYGNVTQSVTFTALLRADILKVTSVPASGGFVGAVSGVPFAVRVLLWDGVTAAAGRNVTFLDRGREWRAGRLRRWNDLCAAKRCDGTDFKHGDGNGRRSDQPGGD